jgi:hypothetical protein
MGLSVVFADHVVLSQYVDEEYAFELLSMASPASATS